MKQEGQQRTQAETPYPLEKPSGTIAPVQFIQAEGFHSVPVPFVRITTCGGLKVEVLQEIISSHSSDSADPAEPPQGRYRLILPQQCPKGSTTALTLLKMLVSLPQHYAAKDWLAEHLPRLRRDTYAEEDEEEGWERGLVRIDNVVSILRNLLCPSTLVGQEVLRKRVITYVKNHRDSGPGYRLAGAPLLWLDVDVIATAVTEAALHEQQGARERQGEQKALPLWEQAGALALQGRYLPEEPYSDWAAQRRAEVDGMGKQAVLALRRLLLARHGQAAQERVLLLLRRAWQSHPTDEDLLYPLMELLSQQERYQEAERYYQQYVSLLDKEASGQTPGQRLQNLYEFLHARQQQQLWYTVNTQRSEQREQSEGEEGTAHIAQQPSTAAPPLMDAQDEDARSPFSPTVTQGIMEAVCESEKDDVDHRRRQVIGQSLKMVGAVATSPVVLFVPQSWNSFSRVFTSFSPVDEKTLEILEGMIDNYWKLFYSTPAPYLLNGVIGLLQTVTPLLDSPSSSSLFRRCCALTSKIALLAGRVTLDQQQYQATEGYYQLALQAAQESHDPLLFAVVLARKAAFVRDEKKQPAKAVPLFQEADRLCSQQPQAATSAWIAVNEAEAWSMMKQETSCLKALEKAQEQSHCLPPTDDPYWTNFAPPLLFGFQGICLLRLHQPEAARQSLQEAISLTASHPGRQEAIFLSDLAATFAQQQEPEEACMALRKALHVAVCSQSSRVMQRLLRVRETLESWKRESCVKSLDEQLIACQSQL